MRRVAEGWFLAHAASTAAGTRLADRQEKTLHFRHVSLRTPRLDALRQFYGDVLRLPIAGDASDRITFGAGETQLALVHDKNIRRSLYHVAFNIPENLIQSCTDWAQKRFELTINPGTGKTLVHFPNWNAHSVYFWDPAGNLLEFIARHSLRNASENSFEMPRDLLCVSEVGVVTQDVAQVDAQLTERLGIERYAPPADGKLPNDFRAMGDVNGLFIVVRRNRRWFMTATGAEPFPAEVEVACGADAEFELADTLCRVRARE
jgi:catechol-2,3-dioxygenase